MEAYDVIVVGVGGMGSAAVAHLARRGVRVLGLEQYDIPHERGSSHGLSRIIRLAYFEHPAYVPLLHRAYELWWALEREVQERLLTITGSLDIGTVESTVFGGALKAAQFHHLVHEVLEPATLCRRFPGYGLQAPLLGLYQPQGGLLAAERCIVAHVNTALRHGAHIHGREALQGWESRGDGIVVRTSRGTYQAQRLVLTAGAWTHRLVTQYKGTLQPERQVMIWMQPRVPTHFQIDAFPVFNMAVEEGTFYGLPIYSIPG
ncbi:MAG TPA: N-methyl-L-tryptophan oxidase, partial [Candidatus Saccharimonadia bacterium]|nr:N-methyl-L-tryptophan oxidase [Candidatus Saccharimonadia bacterium]